MNAAEGLTCPESEITSPMEAVAGVTFCGSDTDPDLLLSATPAVAAQPAPLPASTARLAASRLTALGLSLGGIFAALWITLVFMTTVYLIVPTNDFGRFYHSTVAHWKGEPMYGWNPTVPGNIPGVNTLDGEEFVVDLLNLNPPHFHLIFLPLALLPVESAYSLWVVFGMLCIWASVQLTVNELGAGWTPRTRQVAWLVFLGSAVTTVMVSLGQIGWVLLLPTTLMWLAARRGRWWQCGLWLGTLASIKPFFLILVPYFLLKGNWRVLLAAAGAAVGLVVVSLPIFGVEGYRDWLATLGPADSWAWLEMNGSLWAMLVRSLTENPLYVPAVTLPPEQVKMLFLVIGGGMGLVTVLAAWLDRSPERLDRAFALLLVGALLFSPLGWIYYFPLPVGPLTAVLVTWRRQQGDEPTAGWTRARWWLFGLAVACLFCQPGWTRSYQPAGLATLTLGSLYFWSLVLVWFILVRESTSRGPVGAVVSAPSRSRLVNAVTSAL